MFKVVSIDAFACSLAAAVDDEVYDEMTTTTVTFSAIVDHYKQVKVNEKVRLPLSGCKKVPYDMVDVEFKMQKLAIEKALIGTWKENPVSLEQFELQVSPHRALLSKAKHTAGKLKLVGYSPTIFATNEKPTSGVSLEMSVRKGKDTLQWYVSPKAITIKENRIEKPEDTAVIPYWCVKPTPEESKGNMVRYLHTYHVESVLNSKDKPIAVKVPMLKNSCTISEDDELLIYEPDPKEKKDVGTAAAPPKKKPRK